MTGWFSISHTVQSFPTLRLSPLNPLPRTVLKLHHKLTHLSKTRQTFWWPPRRWDLSLFWSFPSTLSGPQCLFCVWKQLSSLPLDSSALVYPSSLHPSSTIHSAQCLGYEQCHPCLLNTRLKLLHVSVSIMRVNWEVSPSPKWVPKVSALSTGALAFGGSESTTCLSHALSCQSLCGGEAGMMVKQEVKGKVPVHHVLKQPFLSRSSRNILRNHLNMWVYLTLCYIIMDINVKCFSIRNSTENGI